MTTTHLEPVNPFRPDLGIWDGSETVDAFIVGVRQPVSADSEAGAATDAGPRFVIEHPALAALEGSLKELGITGAADQVHRLPAPQGLGAKVLVTTGVGSDQAPRQGTPAVDTTETLRRAAGAATRALTGSTTESVVLALGATSAREVSAVAEGAVIGAYSFTEFKGSGHTPEGSAPVARVLVHLPETTELTDEATQTEVLDRAGHIAHGMHIIQDYVNTPASELFPASFADSVAELVADQAQISTEIWDKDRLVAEGCGGILGIGKGSVNDPRLVKMTYTPQAADDATAHIALVGKGITFDTGGISLKPAASMMTMKTDMTGAATVAAVLRVVAELQLPVKVTGWLAVAENMPSHTAIKPSDVVTIRGGKTVEIMNTDAEGRVVMADALVAATEENPDAVIDIATLTGAQMVALGNRTTGVMGDETVRGELVEAAGEAGELIWPMPIPENQRASLDSRVADLSNMGDRFGGMLTAAAFLRDFVGETPWAHLDIAGPSFNEGSPWGYTGKDATGVMLRTLVTFLSRRA